MFLTIQSHKKTRYINDLFVNSEKNKKIRILILRASSEEIQIKKYFEWRSFSNLETKNIENLKQNFKICKSMDSL